MESGGEIVVVVYDGRLARGWEAFTNVNANGTLS
jgi:hypothetical protein